MKVKDTFILRVHDSEVPEVSGLGECALFKGLSAEDTPSYTAHLENFCSNPSADTLPEISSIRFGYETAMLSLNARGSSRLIESAFTTQSSPIQINGLIWMGTKQEMCARIAEKLDAGFRCVKLKIGGINFDDEAELLANIRREFPSGSIELRLDANGAFTPENALARLNQLSEFDIHSIEQPIKSGQWEEMARLCRLSPIPIALDEELIGFHSDDFKTRLLDTISPAYIILKPSLCGGFKESDRWIELAENRNIGWWATSALESNIGLNAIAQWVARYNPTMPQGLGTGALYTNNFPSPLQLEGDNMYFRPCNS